MLRLRELDLQLQRVGVVAVEHGDLRERNALVEHLQHALRHEGRLCFGEGAAQTTGWLTALANWSEMLGELVLVMHDRGVGESQDRGERAVVGLETKGRAVRVALGEREDVRVLGAAERVDRLRIVPHDHQVAARLQA